MYSPEQVDIWTRPKGAAVIKKFRKMKGLSRKAAELALRFGTEPNTSEGFEARPEQTIITYGNMRGYWLPLKAEEVDYDCLYW